MNTSRRAVRLRGLTAALLVLAGASTSVQSDRSRALTEQIDRIFTARAYDPPRFGPARWLPDSTAYAIVERSGDGTQGSEIARYDGVSGVRTVLVASSSLVPPGAPAPLDIDDYAWSADGRRLLIFTNTRKVWRDNTRGDYWVLDVGSGTLKKVAGKAPASSLMFAKFSPGSTCTGFRAMAEMRRWSRASTPTSPTSWG